MKLAGALIVFIHTMVCVQGGISDFQWKQRILVISGANVKLVEGLEEERGRLEERDVRVFILSGSGEKEYRAGEGLGEELSERLAPDNGQPTVYLIGKDGKTTLKWAVKDFTFRKLYESIDAMPMRRQEMRERK